MTVIFPPWHGGSKAIDILANRITKTGSAVLTFDFHDQILEPNVERVQRSFEHISNLASTAIRSLQKEFDYEHISLLGLSLGTASMALTAEALGNFDSATFVVGSSNLARSMWEGRRTQAIRKDLENQGCTADDLDEAWQNLAPQNHAHAFAGKDVRMILSRNDAIVPTYYQRELVNKFTNAGANVSGTFGRLGHYATAVNFCLRGNANHSVPTIYPDRDTY